jgi:glycosyltransferase involved in cell wall biosynthesis
MKLVYDHQIFSSQQYGGISRYFYEVAKRLSFRDGIDVTILALLYSNEYIRHCMADLVIGRKVPHIQQTRIVKRLINTEISRWWIKRIKPDIVHETYYSFRRTSPENGRIVLTVYDMIHEKFPRFFPVLDKTASAKAKAVRRADHIICISENTRRDLLDIYDIDPQAVSAVHLGYMHPQDRQPAEPIVKDPYILYVGNRSASWKNFSGLLKAFSFSRPLSSQFTLVCFGGGALTGSEVQAAENRYRILQVPGDDGILANLYSNAAAFVYPSLYEGFGLPLLEAMSFRCPVVCSNTGSMPEVAGDGAELFDPADPEDMARAIEKVALSSERADRLRELGMKRLERFSWDACAEETLRIYEGLV